MATSSRHALRVGWHLATDALLFVAAFFLALPLRFGQEWLPILEFYWLPILLGAVSFGALLYLAGLYNHRAFQNNRLRIAAKVALAVAANLLILAALSYLDFSSRVGRGVTVIGSLVAFVFALAHHLYLWRRYNAQRECAALLLAGTEDQVPSGALIETLGRRFDLVGYFAPAARAEWSALRWLGPPAAAQEAAAEHDLARLITGPEELRRADFYQVFTALRYAGVEVQTFVQVCEEIHHCAPLNLVTPEWLLAASSVPHRLYLTKGKRLFDVIVSLGALAVLGVPLLLGMLAVRLTSPGPILYRQVRLGRRGQPFAVMKLRTMRVDAEKHGAVWAVKGRDPRVTPVGELFRKYRIDEIPQIFNVLRGEMSFVGPRPERPEFVSQLDAQIPYNRERLLVRPGITGWAQVNYPYGASVVDARRKLEYDLCYLKHMGVFLDLFILLDTVRIVLLGGVNEKKVRERTPPVAREPDLARPATALPALAGPAS